MGIFLVAKVYKKLDIIYLVENTKKHKEDETGDAYSTHKKCTKIF
jgi:hypothetical protein